jgi:NADH-quinone oxidoreductase subunit L
MAIALIVLAVGSVVAGWVGIGGRFEQFLEPAFGVHTAEVSAEGAGLELTLMGVSTVVAFLGIGIATYFFLKNTRAASAVAARFAGLQLLLQNKYYVDEIYDATVVQPIRITSETGLWKGVDVKVIDGTVNGVGRTIGGSSEILRRLQTGSVRAYAASLFFGVVLILGYYLWR